MKQRRDGLACSERSKRKKVNVMKTADLMHRRKKKCKYGRKKTGRKGCRKTPKR